MQRFAKAVRVPDEAYEIPRYQDNTSKCEDNDENGTIRIERARRSARGVE